MINIVIANNNNVEAKMWELSFKGNNYNVTAICKDLFEMLSILSNEKIHVVVCNSRLLKGRAYEILAATSDFFPQVKLVVVGAVDRSYAFVKLTNVVLKQTFDANLVNYCKIPENILPTKGSKEADEIAIREVSALFYPHFLSKVAADELRATWCPDWKPGYMVMSVLSDSYSELIFSEASKLADQYGNSAVLTRKSDELRIVFHSLSSSELVFAFAEALRLTLLKNADAAFTIGISRMRNAVDELWVSGEEARRAAGSGTLFGQNSIVHIEYMDQNDVIYQYPHHKQKRMIECALDGNTGEALRMLKEIFESFGRAEKISQSLINKICLGIFVDLNTSACARARAFEKTQMDAVSIGDLISAKSEADAHKFLGTAIEHFSEEMSALNEVKRDILFVRLEEYVAGFQNTDFMSMVRYLKTTVQALNDAVYHNTGGSIFDYVKSEEQ